MRGTDGGAGLERGFGVLDAEPDLDGGAAGIERGADERDLGGDGIGDAGDGERGGCADGELLGLHLRDVELGDERGGVHDGDDGSASGGGLAGEEWAVGDDAVDGAANLGVAELGFRAQVFSFGGVELCPGRSGGRPCG